MTGGRVLRSRHRAMGCQWEIVIPRAVYPDAEQAVAAAWREVDAADALLSTFRPDSEISRINREASLGPLEASDLVFALLQRAVSLSRFTHGAFDVTMGSVTRLWGFRDRRPRKPSQEALGRALKSSGYERLLLDDGARTVQFAEAGMEIDLGGFGKGCGVDLAVQALQEHGVSASFVHAGSSTVSAWGEPPDEQGWRVGIRNPGAGGERLGEVVLDNESLSTSADYEQHFEADGERFGHVLDPRTGYPADARVVATVICDSAGVSDALSTAALVLGERAFAGLMRQHPDIRFLFHSLSDNERPRDAGAE